MQIDHNEVKANVQKRNKLIAEATFKATRKGHQMKRWSLYGLNAAMAYCQNCMRQGFIDTNPKPNDAEIYGSVVAYSCTKVK